MMYAGWKSKTGRMFAIAVFAIFLGAALGLGPHSVMAGQKSKRMRVYSTTHGWLWAGEIVRGEPELPIGWRAYPISMFDDVYVVQPDRRHYRVNFKSRPRIGKNGRKR